MATKTRDEVIEQAEAVAQRVSAGPDIHHIVRAIGPISNHAQGIVTGDEADGYLREWLKAGYKLFNTHFAGTKGEAPIIVYILVKE